MTIFRLSYNNGLISYVDGKQAKKTVSNDALLKGVVPEAELDKKKNDKKYLNDLVEETQQKINYLDCIKDGANAIQLKQLNIFPKLEPNYPIFNKDLLSLEENIIKAHSGQITSYYWHKTKPNGSTAELNKSIIYQQVLWEAGLGPKWFVKADGKGTDSESLKTFGSFIDPLEKNNADTTWPSAGNTVEIDERAMTAMGFPNCSLKATTTEEDKFTFEMKIGTGIGCNDTKDGCVITHETPNYQKYFSGNKSKNDALKSKGKGPSTEEKVKMIMIKEWGDKMQCLIYLLKYLNENGTAVRSVMSSCDKVVYILCLLLKVPFIYSGYDDSPNAPTYKHYAISHFKPLDNPIDCVKAQCTDAIYAIKSNNEGFITFLQNIKERSHTKFRLANTYDVHNLDAAFINGCIADIEAYTENAEVRLAAVIKGLEKFAKEQLKNKKLKPEEVDQKIKAEITSIKEEITSIKAETTVVPFMKVKKGNQAHILCDQSRMYTLKTKNAVDIKSNLRKAFENHYGLAKDYDEKKFAGIPFFQLIRGKDKNGHDLKLTRNVSEDFNIGQKRGGTKYINFDGDDEYAIRGFLFPTDNMENLKEYAWLKELALYSGLVPDPEDISTWDRYTVIRYIRRALKERSSSSHSTTYRSKTDTDDDDDDDEGEGMDESKGEGEVFNYENIPTNEDLEANLITGILDYCANKFGHMNFFDTLYNIIIYYGITYAASERPLAEYNVKNPEQFYAVLDQFFNEDGIIGDPCKEMARIEATDEMKTYIDRLKKFCCKPQPILINPYPSVKKPAPKRRPAAKKKADTKKKNRKNTRAVVRLVLPRARAAEVSDDDEDREEKEEREEREEKEEREKRRRSSNNVIHNPEDLNNLVDEKKESNSQPEPKKKRVISPIISPNSSGGRQLFLGLKSGGKKTKKNKRRKRSNKKTRRNIKRKTRKTRNKTTLRKRS